MRYRPHYDDLSLDDIPSKCSKLSLEMTTTRVMLGSCQAQERYRINLWSIMTYVKEKKSPGIKANSSPSFAEFLDFQLLLYSLHSQCLLRWVDQIDIHHRSKAGSNSDNAVDQYPVCRSLDGY